ncbi:MAG TPA: DMT family transporter [Telluria sp.]
MPSLWMLFASFAFAIMGATVKLASEQYSIFEIVLYRGLAGVLILFVLARRQGGTLGTTAPLAHFSRGLVGVASLWLWFSAIARLPLATAVTLNYLSPIWTAAFLMAAAFWRGGEPVRWPLVAAILLSFSGVLLVLQPAFAAAQWGAALMALGSGMLAALAYLLVRRLSRAGEPEYRVVFYFSLMNVLVGLAGITDWHAHSWSGAALLLATGVSGTAGQVALTRAYRVGRTLVVANLQYTGIVFSSVLGFLIWDDRFDWHVWLGMTIILGSGVAVTFYNLHNAAPAARAAA